MYYVFIQLITKFGHGLPDQQHCHGYGVDITIMLYIFVLSLVQLHSNLLCLARNTGTLLRRRATSCWYRKWCEWPAPSGRSAG